VEGAIVSEEMDWLVAILIWT